MHSLIVRKSVHEGYNCLFKLVKGDTLICSPYFVMQVRYSDKLKIGKSYDLNYEKKMNQNPPNNITNTMINFPCEEFCLKQPLTYTISLISAFEIR